MKIKSYAAKTHQGPYLQINEDAYGFDFENDFYFIIDGFGGSGVGDKAVEKLKNYLPSFYSKLTDDPEATMPLYYNPRNLLEGNALVNSLLNSHLNILKENENKSFNQKAGASLICAAKAESILILGGIGNCLAYQFRQGRLTKIFFEENLSSLSNVSGHLKFRTSPLNALGMYPELNYQLREVRLSPRDKIILLTDGAYSHLAEEEILYTLTSSYPDDHHRINNLLNLSNSKGNVDNQTVMILEF